MNDLSQSQLAEAAGARKERVAGSVNTAAHRAGQAVDQILERTGSVPGGEKVANSVHDAAERLKSSAVSLRGGGSPSTGGTVVNLVKSHPVKFAAVALVTILLLGRMLRS